MMIALKAATPQLPRTTAVADHVVAVDETDSTNALAVARFLEGHDKQLVARLRERMTARAAAGAKRASGVPLRMP